MLPVSGVCLIYGVEGLGAYKQRQGGREGGVVVLLIPFKQIKESFDY